MNGHGGLVVVSSGEHLRLLGRNGGVLLDQGGHHAAHGFDTQGQGRHVEQQYVFHITGQNRTLNRSAYGNRFIGVNVLARLFAEEVSHGFLHQRHTGLTTDQNHFVDLGYIQTGVLHRNAARLDAALDQFFNQ